MIALLDVMLSMIRVASALCFIGIFLINKTQKKSKMKYLIYWGLSGEYIH